jgi:cytochrome b involved in lipid metabolism
VSPISRPLNSSCNPFPREQVSSYHLQSYATETSDDESAEGSESDASVPKSSVGEQTMIWREEKGKSVYVPKFYLPRGNNKSFRKDYTMAEVAKHNTLEDCWVVIESHVYDITKFVPNHPGGWLNLQNMAGKDSTDAFANYHQASVYRTLLPAYYIGDVVDSLDDDPFTIEHRSIRQDLLRRGLFETNLYFYYIKVLWLAALLFSAVSLTLYGTTSVRRMSGAVVMVSDWTHAITSNAHVFLIPCSID